MVLNTKAKRVPVHHKKRVGQHHKQTKHYTKTYWPYLPLLLIVVLGMVLNSVWTNSERNVLGYATDMSTSGLLNSTNTQRISNGLGALALNGQLNTAAQAKANDMANRNYWSHNTPDGATPWTFVTQAGYSYQTAGENLAYGFTTSNDTITGWMNSPEHRANMLNTAFVDVGFGIANSANFQGTGPETIVVAMYAKPQAVVPPAPAPAPTKSTPAPAANSTPTPAAPTPAAEATPASPPSEEKATPQQTAATPASAASETPKAADPGTTATNNTPKAQEVSRIQLISQGSAPWSAFAVSSLAVVCVLAFLLRHGLAWRRVFARSETFLVKHHLLDIVLVALGVLGFILTRTSGTIH